MEQAKDVATGSLLGADGRLLPVHGHIDPAQPLRGPFALRPPVPSTSSASAQGLECSVVIGWRVRPDLRRRQTLCGGVPSGPGQHELYASRRTRLPAASDHPCPPLQALAACSQARGIQPQLHPGGARLSTASPSKGVCSGCIVIYPTSRPRAAPAAPALRTAIAHAACGAAARTGLRRPYASAARADEKDPADNPLGRGCDADSHDRLRCSSRSQVGRHRSLAPSQVIS
jgi:hypothetical protein